MIWLMEILKIQQEGREFNIAKNLKYDRYQIGLASVFYKFFDKKSTSLAYKSTKVAMLQSEQLAEELHKPIIKKI